MSFVYDPNMRAIFWGEGFILEVVVMVCGVSIWKLRLISRGA